MEITAKELRLRPGKIIESVSRGMEVFVTYRGRRMAKIVPLDTVSDERVAESDEIFGLWKDHKHENSVDDEVRKMRKVRPF